MQQAYGLTGLLEFTIVADNMVSPIQQHRPPEAVTTYVARPQEWQATLEATGSVAPVQGVTLSGVKG